MDTYNTGYESLEVGAALSLLMPFLIIVLILGIVYIIGMWKVYKKAGVPGWGSIVPFYSQYLLSKITLGNGWLFLLLFIPLVNVVVMILMYLQLANAFGKRTLFGIGLIFLPFIFVLILGFGSAKYEGVKQ